MNSFSNRLALAVAAKKTPVLVGLDPRWEQLPKVFTDGIDEPTEFDVAEAYTLFCRAVIDIVAPLVPAVKPQAAFFEQYGPDGMRALQGVIHYAQSKGLIVIFDGKRNDIGSTASAYAAGLLGKGSSPWSADALTVSPYLGDDSIAPFIDTALKRDAGVFVLVKTSNPGGKTFQDLVADGKPVISISFKDIRRPNFQRSFSVLRTQILSLSRYITPLLDKVQLDDGDTDILSRIKSHTQTEDDTILFPFLVTKILCSYYGKGAIVLLDEYDVPLQNAFLNGFYDEMVSTIRDIMSSLFKGNPNLKFGVVTGCLRISKESIFTGINNFLVNTILTQDRPEHFGFTPSETEKLLTDCGLSGEIGTVHQWYNGYRFGNNDVYNPWSVLCFADQGMLNPESAVQPYWMNTSGNDILKHLIDLYDRDPDTRDEIKSLIDGTPIFKKITESSTFGDLDEDPEHLWSILLFTGYLKPCSGIKTINDEDFCELVLPNNEVRKILMGKLSAWFSRRIKTTRLPDLAEKFLTGNPDDAADEITEFICGAVSLRDSSEDFYQGMLTALMKPQDKEYKLTSNRESGTGYADIVIEDETRSIRAVLEIKRAETPNCPPAVPSEKWDAAIDRAFESALDKAENQIRNRDYTKRKSSKKEFKTKFAYAAAFLNKECRIRKVEI